MTEPLSSFRPWREWVADDGGDVFPTLSSFEWFTRQHRARLVESGQLILRPGSAGNLVGPNLHGLFGRQVATAEGFDYSPALKAETFIWTPEQLDHWLANPGTFVPGNRMSFSGVRKPEDRNAVIAYLMTKTGYVAPETTAEEPVAE